MLWTPAGLRVHLRGMFWLVITSWFNMALAHFISGAGDGAAAALRTVVLV